MTLAFFAIITGLLVLIWSADRFVDGAAALARSYGMPSLLIGMLIVGFGTSMPEMVVSTISSFQGNPGIAMGNAYGSNIFNIAVILGLTAVILPVTLNSKVLQKELPLLCGITFLAGFQLLDGELSREDAFLLLVVFFFLATWSVSEGIRGKGDPYGEEIEKELVENPMSRRQALAHLFSGLFFLILSSRSLVWGGVEIATSLGVSDLIIGLTIVAAGTSLPELASSLAAARKKESDIVIGNIIGSNFFNTLAVVGIAGLIHPMKVSPDFYMRDISVMTFFTMSMFFLGYSTRGEKRIVNRLEGGLLLMAYICYGTYLAFTVSAASSV
ncbi:MAG: calcium/sodium antiporter [bacterium]|nr:calcium/sodium antiporter [bacterium]